jgi:predicted ArsR family transcriptional regulator
MSHSMTLLKMLIERGPLSYNQLAEASGLTAKQVRAAMHSLRVRNATEAVDRPYQVTDAGRVVSQKNEARTKRAVAKAAQPDQPKRPRGRPRKNPPKPSRRDVMVAGAIASRPELQAAWGQMA